MDAFSALVGLVREFAGYFQSQVALAICVLVACAPVWTATKWALFRRKP